MKPIAVFSLFVVVACMAAAPADMDDSDEFDAELIENVDKCKTELKLSDDDITAFNKKGPLTSKSECLVKCVAEKFELIQKGKLVEKEWMEWIDDDKKRNATLGLKELQIYTQCKNTTGTNECNFAGKMFTCLLEGIKKMGLEKELGVASLV